MKDHIVVIDFGSQYTELIVRRMRELQVVVDVKPFSTPLEEISSAKGFIFSGGPFSVYDPDVPQVDVEAYVKVAPVLGLCYGMQLICHKLGGQVHNTSQREYGMNEVSWSGSFFPKVNKVWMSHGDIVDKEPPGFEVLARSRSGHIAAIKSTQRENHVLAMQFHPEVTHTENGSEIFKHFVFDICKAPKLWKKDLRKKIILDDIKKQVGDENVVCALSGGVDSTVAMKLVSEALGRDKVYGVMVDTGLLRKNETDETTRCFKDLNFQFEYIQAQDKFLKNLEKVSDPEKKRKIIGHTFIEIFEDYMNKNLDKKFQWLVQGTLYPDRIESIPIYGQSDVIKSHHNVGGLPEKLNLKIIEPLKDLFKDEVREIGEELDTPHEFLWRHPFPGPGLGIRILGDVTKEKVEILQEADFIYIEELKKHNLYDKIWQAFCVLLPVKTVGVQGDFRTYDYVLSLRAVTSQDGMTADWFDMPSSFLKFISNRITNEVKGINRVVYDVTSKPPGTIEWE